jgi:ParB-like chromosome segregation protein Spo0J
MDPITIVITAIALGAAAGLKPTTEQVVKDAYVGLKTLIQKKYAHVDLNLIEGDPASKMRQGVLAEDLQKTSAAQDEELLVRAKAVLDTIEKHAPEAAKSVGVNLEDIKGASLKIEDIIASGTGVNVKKAELQGDIEIRGIRAGETGKGRPKAGKQ